MRDDNQARTPEKGNLDRRHFLRALGGITLPLMAGGVLPGCGQQFPAPARTTSRTAETAVKALYDGLTIPQKRIVCLDWDYTDAQRGLVRTFVANHWQVTRPAIRSEFYTTKQQGIIHDIFRSLIHPDWYTRFLKQLHDDCLGHPWGTNQSIAIFGQPGTDRFEFIVTGRHLTLRADGNSEARVAFGGPLFLGHAASGYHEQIHHPGNIFWPQAEKANRVFQLLDPSQRELALVERRPSEPGLGFRDQSAAPPGIAVSEFNSEQKAAVNQLLQTVLEPFRDEDQQRVRRMLEHQGGLDRCHLTFFKEGDLGNDGEWDNWRLEGPSFIWYFRGSPHVHVWIHVADDSTVAANAKAGQFLDPSHDVLYQP